MSRIAKKPLIVPVGVELKVVEREVHIKGKKGIFTHHLHEAVVLEIDGNKVQVRSKKQAHPMVGTTYKLLGNMLQGVHDGFEKKLQLVGVGYRAKTQGKGIELSLGFSNPVQFDMPAHITVDTPTNTEIVIKGIDRQVVGEIAAKVRAIRPPEPYKGKGVRYADETVNVKETKKK
jgi:large subunit ribosomal protein L6